MTAAIIYVAAQTPPVGRAQLADSYLVTYADNSTEFVVPHVQDALWQAVTAWLVAGGIITPLAGAALTAYQNTTRAKIELAALDAFIPRGLEDSWTAFSEIFDVAKLPQVTQTRLLRKRNLRAYIAGRATGEYPSQH